LPQSRICGAAGTRFALACAALERLRTLAVSRGGCRGAGSVGDAAVGSRSQMWHLTARCGIAQLPGAGQGRGACQDSAAPETGFVSETGEVGRGVLRRRGVGRDSPRRKKGLLCNLRFIEGDWHSLGDAMSVSVLLTPGRQRAVCSVNTQLTLFLPPRLVNPWEPPARQLPPGCFDSRAGLA